METENVNKCRKHPIQLLLQLEPSTPLGKTPKYGCKDRHKELGLELGGDSSIPGTSTQKPLKHTILCVSYYTSDSKKIVSPTAHLE